MAIRYALLPLILLVISVGFSSVAFAADDSVLSLESSFESSFDYSFVDTRPLNVDQFTSNSPNNSPLSPQISSDNFDNSMLSTQVSSSHPMQSSSGLDARDDASNLLAVALFAIPFGALVFRMSDEESLSKKYLKLSSTVLVLGMVSLLTSQTVAVGNNYWGYAFAELDPEMTVPDAIDSLQFDHSDKENIFLHGDAKILDTDNPTIHFDGKESYLSLDSDLPSKLKSFSVSAWVKPDYRDGSAMFSVGGTLCHLLILF